MLRMIKTVVIAIVVVHRWCEQKQSGMYIVVKDILQLEYLSKICCNLAH